jgi:excisionase family DNA binding protein
VTRALAKSTPELGASAESGESVIVIDGRASRELMRQIAVGALRSGIAFLKAQIELHQGAPVPPSPPRPLDVVEPERDVMTADEVAAFLGVDRNTVYDYAGRGVIPHQRLGKRVLFRRGALVSWLDASCKATSTRKG